MHSKTSHLRSSFEPHAVKFAHPLISGESASGTEDIPLPGDYFRSELNETSNLKVEVFLIDSKECHSASKFEFLELEEKEETKAAEGSYWIKVGGWLSCRINNFLTTLCTFTGCPDNIVSSCCAAPHGGGHLQVQSCGSPYNRQGIPVAHELHQHQQGKVGETHS